MTDFDSASAFRQCVEQALVRGGLNAEMAAEQSGALARKTALSQPPLGDGLRLFYPKRKWAIRDEDLRLLETLGEVLTLCIVGSALVTPAGFVAALVPVFLLLRRAYRRGARLRSDHCLVLMALKSRPGGLTANETTQVLNSVGQDLGEARVSEILEELQAFRLPDGDVVELVQSDAHDRWGPGAL